MLHLVVFLVFLYLLLRFINGYVISRQHETCGKVSIILVEPRSNGWMSEGGRAEGGLKLSGNDSRITHWF